MVIEQSFITVTDKAVEKAKAILTERGIETRPARVRRQWRLQRLPVRHGHRPQPRGR